MTSNSNHNILKGVNIQQIRGIIFDFDNTLIATRQIDEAACDHVLTSLHDIGVPVHLAAEITLEFYRQYRVASKLNNTEPRKELEPWRHQVWKSVLTHFGLEDITESVYNLWHRTRLSLMVMDGDVIELIKKLDRKYRLAVLTNGESLAQWEKVNASNLQDLIPPVVVSGDTGFIKPHKEIFEMVFNKIQVPPHECMMVGDNPHTDIQGGLNSGVGMTVQMEILRVPGGTKTLPTKPKLNVPPLELDILRRRSEQNTNLLYNKQLEMYQMDYSKIYEEEKKLRLCGDDLVDFDSTNDGANIMPNLFLKSVMDLEELLNGS